MSSTSPKITFQRPIKGILDHLYTDTQDASTFTCDLIIKCGSELFQYYCHKAILASCSNFLKEALSCAPPGAHPVLILPDIRPTTFNQILKYLYYGEIHVDSETDYEDFIDGCNYLQIKVPSNNNHIECETFEEDEKNIMEVDDYVEVPYLIVNNIGVDDNFEENIPNTNINLIQDDDSEQSSVKEDVFTEMHEPESSKTDRYKRKELTSEETVSFLQRAETCMRIMYHKINEKPVLNLDAVIESTELQFSRSQWLKAGHSCPFDCGQMLYIFLDLRKSHTWRNKSFMNHLTKKHKVTMKIFQASTSSQI